MKIVIDCKHVDPEVALDKVLRVIKMGKLSKDNGIPHYAWLTFFTDDIIVRTSKKEADSDPDVFIVERDEEPG